MTMDAVHWQGRLDQLVEQFHVPGASLAVMSGEQVTAVATGVVNCETGVAATPEAVFQIGSITKVWTTTLLMQLAEQGRLDLDASLAEVLPELTLEVPGATGQIKVRHLLSHSSGIDGDFFADTGRGDDCVARYVAACAKLALLYPPGATMSYCNSGFVIAGRIVEQLTGQGWDDALRHGLIQPLGLKQTVTLPEEVLRFRAAYGHLTQDGQQRLAPVWALPRSLGPAGVIVATASDVIEFARLHLRQGRAADGTQVLSASSVDMMQQPQVTVPGSDPAAPRQVGLGWFLYEWGGQWVLGHNGGTVGQAAFLRVLPDDGGAVCLLTNGGDAHSLSQQLMTEIAQELWQLEVPAPAEPAPDTPQADPAGYLGRYEREGAQLDVAAGTGGLTLTWTDTGPMAEELTGPPMELALAPVAQDVFATKFPGMDRWTPVVFYQLADGGQYVHIGARATPKRG
jgi:CubicO group peptidase (beta-lactamase class C family)